MSLKKKAIEALKNLPLLTKSFAPEPKKKALDQINVVTRFVGELRQERSTLKQRTEKAEAESEPLRDQLHKLNSQLSDALSELDRAKRCLIAATAIKVNDTPQGRLAYLIPGLDQPTVATPEERKATRQKRRKQLHDILPEMLPDWNLKVLEVVDMLFIHQDAFAAGYHADEYTMLGMAIKFAGDHGKKITITGLSGETCGEEWAEEVERLREQSGNKEVDK